MSEYAIRVENLCKYYGAVRAVDQVNFQVTPGEMVGFLGPNGAGKSTTMRILTTFLPATSGIATVCGHDVMTESMQVRQCIGYLPESVPLYPEMRVEEYLLFRAKLKAVDRAIRKRRLDECIEKCRIKEVRRRLLGTLSKGYRQRVGLADALLADPKVLILDEPTSGLDPIQIRETLNTIKALAGTHTVLLSTHILSEVEAICDRVVIINRGTLRWDGRLSRLADELPQFVMQVRGPEQGIMETLRAHKGVSQIDTQPMDNGFLAVQIRPVNSEDLREPLARLLYDKGYSIRQLDLRRKNLEALYTEVVIGRNEERA